MAQSEQDRQGLFQNPKIVFGFILFLVVIGVGAGAFRFANGVRGGFASNKVSGDGELVLDDNEQLKQKDTDSDSLSDYEELYAYRTSPYLKDTDSDGVDDRAEIDSGKDPNCPEGKSCKQFAPSDSQGIGLEGLDNGPLPAGASNQNVDAQTLDTLQAGEFLDLSGEQSVGGNGSTQSENGAGLDLNNLTAAQIRKLLLDSGKITKNQLDAIDDETLLSEYQQVLKEQ